jgi:hypothetical protein
VWHRLGRPDGDIAAFCARITRELVASGALRLGPDGVVHDH